MNASMFALCLMLIEEPDDQEKFQIIYDNYNEDMFKAAQGILRDYALAEDAVQIAFVRIARVIKRIDMDNNPRSFVITVVKNVAKDIVEQYEKEMVNFDTYSIYYESSDAYSYKTVEERDFIEYVANYVMTLKPIYSEVFLLRYHYEMKYDEISQLLNVDVATLRKRMERLREMIYDYLERGK